MRVPRTREKNFKPTFLQDLKEGLFSFEELILAMYQGGCSTRDISKTLKNLFEMRYSPLSVSKIVSVVEEEVEKFKKRKIEGWYPVIYVDGVYLKIRRGSVSGEAVYVVMGISEEGYKEILSFCVSGSEGESAEVWKDILRELKERGLEKPLLFVGDGLPGLREAIKEVYPLADFQHCILHRVMASLRRVRKRDREAVAYDLRKIYKARSEAEFLRGFKRRWMRVYPDVIRSWEERMEELISYLRYPEELRAMIYTTNVLERFFKEVKRRSKVIEVFPGQVSAEKVLYLVIKEMNERYKERRIKNFEEIIENLRALRRERYRDE